jgi:hypothetical protein
MRYLLTTTLPLLGCAPGSPTAIEPAAPESTAFTPERPAQPLGAESFGVDFWVANATSWQAVFDTFDADGVALGLAGSQIGWEHLEPDPPRNGNHAYTWERIDPLLEAVARSGRVLDLDLLCRSPWATVVAPASIHPNDRCCAMSPPRADAECTRQYGVSCGQAWRELVAALVERYDGDGVSDAPFADRPLLRIVKVGDEPEVPSHFASYGGSTDDYIRLLELTRAGAKAASGDILVARGKSNPGHIFDDDPDPGTLWARRPDYLAFVRATLAAAAIAHYDVFAVNFNDHSTGLAPLLAWLREEMLASGVTRPFLVSDARTTPFPRDNDGPAHVLPPRYPQGFIASLADPASPRGAAARALYRADEARQSLRKVIVAVAQGALAFSLQPAFQLGEPPTPLWQDAGLFDAREAARGDFRAGREPAYHAQAALLRALVGARALEPLATAPNVFAYRVEGAASETFLLWHEDPRDVDATGLVRRGQTVSLDLSAHTEAPTLLVTTLVPDVDRAGDAVPPAEKSVPARAVPVDETPLIARSERWPPTSRRRGRRVHADRPAPAFLGRVGPSHGDEGSHESPWREGRTR